MSTYSRTPESPSSIVTSPGCKNFRIKKPTASLRLTPANNIGLSRVLIYWREPGLDDLIGFGCRVPCEPSIQISWKLRPNRLSRLS